MEARHLKYRNAELTNRVPQGYPRVCGLAYIRYATRRQESLGKFKAECEPDRSALPVHEDRKRKRQRRNCPRYLTFP
jgi:hypothetical protein